MWSNRRGRSEKRRANIWYLVGSGMDFSLSTTDNNVIRLPCEYLTYSDGPESRYITHRWPWNSFAFGACGTVIFDERLFCTNILKFMHILDEKMNANLMRDIVCDGKREIFISIALLLLPPKRSHFGWTHFMGFIIFRFWTQFAMYKNNAMFARLNDLLRRAE